MVAECLLRNSARQTSAMDGTPSSRQEYRRRSLLSGSRCAGPGCAGLGIAWWRGDRGVAPGVTPVMSPFAGQRAKFVAFADDVHQHAGGPGEVNMPEMAMIGESILPLIGQHPVGAKRGVGQRREACSGSPSRDNPAVHQGRRPENDRHQVRPSILKKRRSQARRKRSTNRNAARCAGRACRNGRQADACQWPAG